MIGLGLDDFASSIGVKPLKELRLVHVFVRRFHFVSLVAEICTPCVVPSTLDTLSIQRINPSRLESWDSCLARLVLCDVNDWNAPLASKRPSHRRLANGLTFARVVQLHCGA